MTTKEQVTAEITAEILTSSVTGKKWYFSKTIWANAVVGIALILQSQYGFIIGPELQALALVAINMGLRKITDEAIVW